MKNSPIIPQSFVASMRPIADSEPQADASAKGSAAVMTARERADRAVELARAGDFRTAKVTAACISDAALRNETQVRIAELRQPLSPAGY